MKAKGALTRKIPAIKQKSQASAGNPMDRSHGLVQRPLSIQKGYPSQAVETRNNIRSLSPFNGESHYNAKATEYASKLTKNMHVFSGNDINRTQLGKNSSKEDPRKKRSTKTALVLKTDIEENESVDGASHK